MNTSGVSLRVTNLSKSWGETRVLKGIDFEIEAGTFLTILGPSGCGKSTALRLIAGLESVSGGGISIDGADVTGKAAADRNIGMVFQNYALFPHMSVRDNILYGLKVRGKPKRDRARGLARVADLMDLGPLLDRKPAQLSGGQQQRVALARVLVSERPLVLMDEPLSNLDAKLRAEIRSEIKELNRTLGITVVYVTHDQSEALSMSDKVLLMRAGQAVQFGTPEELYTAPASVAAARFIGTPPMNVISGAHLPALTRHVSPGGLPDDCLIGIRPEHLYLTTGSSDASFEATVIGHEYEGNLTLVKLTTGLGEPLTVTLPSEYTPVRGAGVHVGCRSKAIRLFRTVDGTPLSTTAIAIDEPAPVAGSL